MGCSTACRAAALATGLVLAASPASANRASAELNARAANELYSLDRDRAVATYREAIAADPEDPAAHRGLASALWLSIAFDRGNMTVDDYVGRLSRSKLKLPPPKAEVAAEFSRSIERALEISRRRVAANPDDIDAHFELGAAIGLRASYVVTVEGSVIGAFRAAREAFNEHERVLELDPKRADAGLIVGTYRYAVSVLSLPLRWVAYVSGFGGGRERGIHMVEQAARYSGQNQTDAQLALVLLYSREGQHAAAVEQLARLREQYPRNRLLWLETGSACIRAGRAGEAERFLTEGLARMHADSRRRMLGEEAVWHYKRGLARANLGHVADAETDLRKALTVPGRGWVHGRARLELGRLLLKAGDRRAAEEEFQQAIRLCENDNDPVSADEARRLMR
jgi:tetratricopeptide (TPR) repeat protein